MKIVRMDSRYYRDALQLSAFAFQYELTKAEAEKRMKMLESQDIFGVFENEQLAAKLHIHPFEIWFNKQKIKMGGIAGVATYPEYRRKGYVKELIAHSLAEMKTNGQTVSFLHAFSISFYRKYGWEVFSNYHKAFLTKADFIRKEKTAGYVKRFTKDFYNEDIETAYEKYARKFTGMLVRKRERFLEYALRDALGAVYYNSEGEPRGYIVYKIADSKMTVKEFAAVDQEARTGLWNFICQHDSMAKKAEINLPEKDPLLFTLENPNVKTVRHAYGMARIVDVKEFLQIYPFHWEGNEAFTFQVEDEFAPWNTGVFTVRPSEQPTYAKAGASLDAGISLSINALTALLLGYKTAAELAEIGWITGSEAEIYRIDKLLPELRPNLFDFF